MATYLKAFKFVFIALIIFALLPSLAAAQDEAPISLIDALADSRIEIWRIQSLSEDGTLTNPMFELIIDSYYPHHLSIQIPRGAWLDLPDEYCDIVFTGEDELIELPRQDRRKMQVKAFCLSSAGKRPGPQDNLPYYPAGDTTAWHAGPPSEKVLCVLNQIAKLDGANNPASEIAIWMAKTDQTFETLTELVTIPTNVTKDAVNTFYAPCENFATDTPTATFTPSSTPDETLDTPTPAPTPDAPPTPQPVIVSADAAAMYEDPNCGVGSECQIPHMTLHKGDSVWILGRAEVLIHSIKWVCVERAKSSQAGFVDMARLDLPEQVFDAISPVKILECTLDLDPLFFEMPTPTPEPSSTTALVSEPAAMYEDPNCGVGSECQIPHMTLHEGDSVLVLGHLKERIWAEDWLCVYRKDKEQAGFVLAKFTDFPNDQRSQLQPMEVPDCEASAPQSMQEPSGSEDVASTSSNETASNSNSSQNDNPAAAQTTTQHATCTPLIDANAWDMGTKEMGDGEHWRALFYIEASGGGGTYNYYLDDELVVQSAQADTTIEVIGYLNAPEIGRYRVESCGTAIEKEYYIAAP